MSDLNAVTAIDLLTQAADAIDQRDQLRDQPSGERSMARAVRAFNAMYGHHLTEQHGWQFMALLKMARGAGGRLHVDDYVDQAAYAALAGECVAGRLDAPHVAATAMPLHSKPHFPT